MEEECDLKKWLEDNNYKLDYSIELNEVWTKGNRTIIRHPIIGLRNSYHDSVNEDKIKKFLEKNNEQIKKVLIQTLKISKE